MGRGRIRAGYGDEGGLVVGALPTKDLPFTAASLPNADPAVFRELKAAVAKVEARIGIDLPQSNLGFTNDKGFLGVHFGSGDSRTVLLSTHYFDKPIAEIIAAKRRDYKAKWTVDTTTPVQHTMIHELGHSIWVNRVEGQARSLDPLSREIRKLYSSFRKEVDAGKIPISRYATTNINEFVAETFTKGVIGTKQNKYSRALIGLFKKYRKELKGIR